MRSGAERRVRARAARAVRRPAVFEGILFHLDKPIDYKVVSNGVESPLFTMTLVDLPTVAKLELEYRYPAYTGLPPQKIENGGDVAALRGTEVFLHIVPTMNTPSGRDSAERVGVASADAAGRRVAHRQLHDRQAGLLPHRARRSARRARHGVAAVHDRRHRRSLADRVVPQAGTRHDGDGGRRAVRRSEGVRRLRRQAARARLRGQRRQGKDRQAVRRREAARPRCRPATRSISRSSASRRATRSPTTRAPPTPIRSRAARRCRATSTSCRSGRSGRTSSRRSRRRGGGGGGGGGNDVGQLSQQQKEIVAATFNVIRDKAKLSAEKYRENVVFLTLSQGKLKTQVDELHREDEEPSGRSGRAVQEDCRPAGEGLAGNGDGGSRRCGSRIRRRR